MTTEQDDDTRADFAGNYAECFDADGVGDRDPMYDDAPGGDYKCAGSDGRPCCVDHDGKFVGPGCRHCNPVDHECKPYGYGFDRFESLDSLRICREMRALSAWSHTWPFAAHDSMRLALEWAGFDFRTERASDRVWDRICNDAETHSEAVYRFTAWAGRVKTAFMRGA